MENLPSFLSLGKTLLLLFVGEEEDEIGHRQNQALVEEMKHVVELGGVKMERYLACWIHLCAHTLLCSLLFHYFLMISLISRDDVCNDGNTVVGLFHSGRTPAGMSVLGSYLGSLPPLPALVHTRMPSGDEVYQYPPSSPIVAPSVLQWLQRIEEGTESPAGKEELV